MSPAEILLKALLRMKEAAPLMTNKVIHQNYQPSGICFQMNDLVTVTSASFSDKLDAKRLFNEIMEGQGRDWPGHSGCYIYPVPHDNEEELRRIWSGLTAEQQEMYADCDSFEVDAPEPQQVPFENCPSAGLAELAFDNIPQKYFWDANHPYGKARLEFLDHLIMVVKERI